MKFIYYFCCYFIDLLTAFNNLFLIHHYAMNKVLATTTTKSSTDFLFWFAQIVSSSSWQFRYFHRYCRVVLESRPSCAALRQQNYQLINKTSHRQPWWQPPPAAMWHPCPPGSLVCLARAQSEGLLWASWTTDSVVWLIIEEGGNWMQAGYKSLAALSS